MDRLLPTSGCLYAFIRDQVFLEPRSFGQRQKTATEQRPESNLISWHAVHLVVYSLPLVTPRLPPFPFDLAPIPIPSPSPRPTLSLLADHPSLIDGRRGVVARNTCPSSNEKLKPPPPPPLGPVYAFSDYTRCSSRKHGLIYSGKRAIGRGRYTR